MGALPRARQDESASSQSNAENGLRERKGKTKKSILLDTPSAPITLLEVLQRMEALS
jgi:hypothetical protein